MVIALEDSKLSSEDVLEGWDRVDLGEDSEDCWGRNAQVVTR